ncbi:hypothetical protein [Streptomyces sp. cg36]|uniref:hypothetical protein n=1 Tax=Streptomyces sp. cg36 TaxID=3238798 RepID=UPI0034E1E31C
MSTTTEGREAVLLDFQPTEDHSETFPSYEAEGRRGRFVLREAAWNWELYLFTGPDTDTRPALSGGVPGREVGQKAAQLVENATGEMPWRRFNDLIREATRTVSAERVARGDLPYLVV